MPAAGGALLDLQGEPVTYARDGRGGVVHCFADGEPLARRLAARFAPVFLHPDDARFVML